ncbi:globin-coupled sensor protein [Shimia sagamensis]|uniref:Methyl-accepting chemotaxis sensory transducer n=1 Tax=Shimia sagamensis TaxID=1566352 RepID=A0ABY1PCZ0_9RHOB|nr:globin-coupled sensor protein [Shimia sagamensis]SMP30896.1 methyl-accepting chemotaxis sensory transducer [Shimia sagamensis]
MTQNLAVAVTQFGLNGKDGETLARAGAKVIPWLDEVLDYFYDYAQEDAARFFHTEGLLEHARNQQKKHWAKLLSGTFDDGFAAATKTIGEVHFRIELPFDLYLAGYSRATSYIQTLFLKRSSRILGPIGKAEMARQLSVLTRAFTLDMNLVIEAYFNAQQEEQARAFRYLRDGMGRMGRKDLSEDIPSPEHSDFPVRYEDMRLGFNALQSDMGEVMRSIKNATEDLDLTAAEVNSGADDLAHRTETQAATLEQTTQSVEQITKSVQSSSSATQETDAMMSQTHQKAKTGQDVMQETVEKMREIAESSAQISQITGVIDDIAFQTNLLALNAGVEAARAGDAGRGFAVVASEVRGLAQRAAESAAEISELIKASSDLVENGVEMVDQAGRVLGDIVNKVEAVAGLTSQVANSSLEQSEGLSGIASSLSQLDNVTQQNAAMVEQTAAAVGSMQRDTTSMAQLIGEFALSPEGEGYDAEGENDCREVANQVAA